MQRAQQTTADDAAANARAIRDAAQTASSADAVEADTVQLRRLQDGAAGIAGLQARLDVQWEELVARRAAADRRAVSALQEPEVLGRILSARAITAMGDEQFLAWVGSLDHEAIARQPTIRTSASGWGARTLRESPCGGRVCARRRRTR